MASFNCLRFNKLWLDCKCAVASERKQAATGQQAGHNLLNRKQLKRGHSAVSSDQIGVSAVNPVCYLKRDS